MPEIPPSTSGHPRRRVIIGVICVICLVGIGWAFYLLYTGGPPRYGAPMKRPTINAVTPPTRMPHIATPQAVALRNQAVAEWKEGKRAQAMTDISQSIKTDPSWADPYGVRGKWEADQGDPRAALDDLNNCVERKPDIQVMIAALSQRARAKQALGDSAGATADRQEVRILQNKERHQP